VRHYQGPLYRLALRLLADRGEAEDALQDAMVQIWRRLPGLADPQAFRRWAYQVMTRRCVSLLRVRARRSTAPMAEDDLVEVVADQGPTTTGGPDDPVAAAQYRAQLRGLHEVLATLPDEQRACWVLREMHELTYPEIAYAMNLPLTTVRGRLGRARQNLVKGMEAWR
jgi:RNA polymerase sigma-70 factor, ECF subfamily